MKLNFNNVNPNKLHDELIVGGITPILVENDLKDGGYKAENTWITFPDDADTAKINDIVANHNSTPATPQPTDEERLASIESTITTLLEV